MNIKGDFTGDFRQKTKKKIAVEAAAVGSPGGTTRETRNSSVAEPPPGAFYREELGCLPAQIILDIYVQADFIASSEQSILGRVSIDLRGQLCKNYEGEHMG